MDHIGLGDIVKIDHMGMTARGTVVGVALGVGRCDILLDEQNTMLHNIPTDALTKTAPPKVRASTLQEME